MLNHVLTINGESAIINQSTRKILWLALPELVPISKYYTKSNYVHTMDSGSLIIIDKNCVNFITTNLPPLTLSLFKQDFLDWQPLGGLCLSATLILYDKHKINFYQRAQNLKKSWTIQVMQQICQIKSSPLELVIGMTVKQKKDTIFLWNLNDISNKPFQQVTVSQQIVKWQFYTKDMLAILTPKQFQIYFPKDGQYNLQFFIQMAHLTIDFCFLHRPKTTQHSGRKSVYPVCILSPNGKMFLYQLFDIDKRIKNSSANILATVELQQNTSSILCGYQNQRSQIILCGQTLRGKPFCTVLNSKFVLKNKYQFLPQLQTKNQKLIQYCKQIICTEDQQKNEKQQITKKYKLFTLIEKDRYQFIQQYQCNNFAILGGYNLFCFNKQTLQIYQKKHDFKIENKIVVNQIKIPPNLFLLEQKQNIAYFLSGIRLYRLDVQAKLFKNIGFTIKNDRFKLVHVRNQTRSILYKSQDQYLLIQYQTPQNYQNQAQKIGIKTIKSSVNSIVSLRNNRWAQKLPNKIIIGEGNKILQQFDLAKFFKYLTLQNILFEYQIFWTTHDGILLLIKNYLFILELVQSPDGYSINPIKKSLNFLHCRLNPDVQSIQIMDARNIVIREGSRILRLGGKLGNFVSENPYQLPDTLLNRQLMMRKLYPPHHPKVVQYLIQLGLFDLLQRQFENLWLWINQNGKINQLYERIGQKFFVHHGKSQEKLKNIMANNRNDQLLQQQQESESIFKKLCQKILQNPSILNLQQNYSLILQSQIQAFIFRQQNARSMDFYSQVILTQFKTFQTKNLAFQTMHIAYMLHSINKQEAIEILKRQKTQIDWQWIKKYSIIMWYQSKNQIKAWAQQIGANLFKINKEPFDCLLWYTIAGKKTVLVQLFKKYTFNSAQHEAIFKFLQRDFTDPKNQNAAVKNAYVLIDKKRYMHALAFFIYGQKIDEAISVCLNKLKDINLALLICNNLDDKITKNKIIQILLNNGDVWAKHIAYFYKNQHIDSFNCLFQQQKVQAASNWELQLKQTNFHPAIKKFAQMIQKSIPVKRQLQQQQLKKNKVDSNDIFDSFFGNQEQNKVEQQPVEQKQLTPNYEKINKQSVAYFIRNSCSILALMLDPTNHRAKRAYDLCQFLLTKQINASILQLIEDLQDYISIIDSKRKQNIPIKPFLQKFTQNLRNTINKINISGIINLQKSKVGELMHFGYYSQKIVGKLKRQKIPIDNKILNDLQILKETTKIILILQLQVYQKIQEMTQQFLLFLFQPSKIKQDDQKIESFWQVIKCYYNKLAQVKKNKKQNLYDTFEQNLYKYIYKKPENTVQNTNHKLSIQFCTPLFVKKIFLQNVISILNEKNQQQTAKILIRIKRQLSSIVSKWAEQKVQDQLIRQMNQMSSEGVVSKLKVTFLTAYLNQNFQNYCRALILIKSKAKKQVIQKDRQKYVAQKFDKLQVIQIFRNKQEGTKAISINKNDGQGMQVAILTKRGVKKIQICDSLVNRNRSQQGISLIHQDTFYNMDSQFDYNSLHSSTHLPIIQKFLNGVIQNRKEYDGLGIIKGSTKRMVPQYLKSLDSIPFVESGQINCIQCHHYLPIYMLGGKSNIQLCSFSSNSNYNRIKCPILSDIIKIRSFQQRVTALDKEGNLGSFSFDSKILGNNVFSIKKSNIIDFCPMTPTTYGFCTNNSIQVVDSLLHPKRQVVFKTQTNQVPIAIDYYNQTKLAICRRSDVVIYDTRMDIQVENRDLGGRAKCMTSNYRNKVLVGKMDNKVRVLDLTSLGSESDYDVKCISNYRGNQNMSDKISIEDIEIMGKFVLTLSSQGIISMFNIQ